MTDNKLLKFTGCSKPERYESKSVMSCTDGQADVSSEIVIEVPILVLIVGRCHPFEFYLS